MLVFPTNVDSGLAPVRVRLAVNQAKQETLSMCIGAHPKEPSCGSCA